MKKKIFLVVIMFMLFMGVVNASSINGDFEGNPVVKLLDNGKEVAVDDVPAIIYNNRTMVPIYLLKKMGVQVTWDLDKYSVDVKMPTVTVTSAPIATIPKNIDIDTIKFYSRIQYEYQLIQDLGDIIKDISQGYSLAYDGINLNRTDQLTKMNSRLNEIIDMYNNNIKIVTATTKELFDRKIYDNSFVDIMNNYSKALDYFKECDKYLNLYYSSRSNSDFNAYLDNSGKGFDTAFEGKKIAFKKHDEYYNLVQKF